MINLVALAAGLNSEPKNYGIDEMTIAGGLKGLCIFSIGKNDRS